MMHICSSSHAPHVNASACNSSLPRVRHCFTMADLASLEKRLAEAQANFQQSQREVKRQRLYVREERKKEKKQWLFPPFAMNVLLILYYLANYHSVVAVSYAQKLARKTKWDVLDDEQVAHIVEEMFLAVDLDHFVMLIDVSNDTPHHIEAAMRIAVKFKAEFDAAQWTKRNNTAKGIAPPSSVILAKIIENRIASPLHIDPPPEYLHNDSSTGRTYMWRWRKQWGGRYGGIRALNDISAEASKEKVSALVFYGYF